jgi:hypothetical protein
MTSSIIVDVSIGIDLLGKPIGVKDERQVFFASGLEHAVMNIIRLAPRNFMRVKDFLIADSLQGIG